MLHHQYNNNKIKVNLDFSAAHWEAYPFDPIRFRKGMAALEERGIQFTDLDSADCIITNNPSTKDIPTIIIEGSDFAGIKPATRNFLNTNPTARVWKWGKYSDDIYACYRVWKWGKYSGDIYQKIDGLYPAGHIKEQISFNIEQVDISYNLLWEEQFYGMTPFRQKPKVIDIAFIGTLTNKIGTFKHKHRLQCIDAVNKLPNSLSKVIILDHLSQEDFCNILSQTKICISPWGNCEITARDTQGLLHGCAVIRPKTKHFLTTWPDIWSDSIECETDYSDLEEKVDEILSTGNVDKYNNLGTKWREIRENRWILANRIYELIDSQLNQHATS
jgi:hypothetical protein